MADGTGVPANGTERERRYGTRTYDEYHKVPAHTVTYRTVPGITRTVTCITVLAVALCYCECTNVPPMVRARYA